MKCEVCWCETSIKYEDVPVCIKCYENGDLFKHLYDNHPDLYNEIINYNFARNKGE